MNNTERKERFEIIKLAVETAWNKYQHVVEMCRKEGLPFHIETMPENYRLLCQHAFEEAQPLCIEAIDHLFAWLWQYDDKNVSGIWHEFGVYPELADSIERHICGVTNCYVNADETAFKICLFTGPFTTTVTVPFGIFVNYEKKCAWLGERVKAPCLNVLEQKKATLEAKLASINAEIAFYKSL